MKSSYSSIFLCRCGSLAFALLVLTVSLSIEAKAASTGVFTNSSAESVTVGGFVDSYMGPQYDVFYLFKYNLAPGNVCTGSYDNMMDAEYMWMCQSKQFTNKWVVAPPQTDLSSSYEYTGLDTNLESLVVVDVDEKRLRSTRDPIDKINGNVSVSESDIVIRCPGIDLAFARSYNSIIASTGSLGPRWRHSYDWFLTDTNAIQGSETNVYKVLNTGQGENLSFRQTGTNEFASPFGSNYRLAVLTSGAFRVTMPGERYCDFDTNGVMTGIFDAWGNTVTLTYTNNFPSNQLTKVEHSNGQYLSFSYTSNLLVGVSTPISGFEMSFGFGPYGSLTNATRHFSGASRSVLYFYDDSGTNSNHSLTQRVNAAGHVFAYEYATNASGQATSVGIANVVEGLYYDTTLDFSGSNNAYTVETLNRGDTNQVYWNYFDPGDGRITYIFGPNSSNSYTFYGRHPNGEVAFVETGDSSLAETSTTHYLYDLCLNVTGMVSELNGSSSNWSFFSWDTNSQVLLSATDAQGAKVEYEYTNAYPSSVKVFYDGTNSFDSAMTYTTNGLLTSVINANGHWVSNYYNGYGFLTSSVPQAGIALRQEVNSLGYVTKRIISNEAGTFTISNDVDEIGQIHHTMYAQSGDTNAAPLHEYFYWDATGNLTNFVDKAGRSTRYSYLPGRKLSSVSRTLDGSNITTSVSYDNQFNTLNITDPLGRAVESYVLDIQDRPVTITNLEGQAMSITYGLGRMVRQISRFDGTSVSNSYGVNGLVSQTVFPYATNSFTYLKNNLLSTITDGQVTVSNAYNKANWMTNVTVSGVVSIPLNVGYSYLPAGNVSSVVSVAGTKTYGHDAGERVTDIDATHSGAPDLSFDLGYDQYRYGQLTEIECTNTGIRAVYSWDSFGNIENIIWYDASSNVIRLFNYSKDAVGMITYVGDGTGAGTSYAYDDLDRLLSETKTDSAGTVIYAETNTYDAAGNRIAKTRDGMAVTYSHESGNNRLSGWSVSGTNQTVQLDIIGVANEAVGAGSHWGEYYISNSLVKMAPESSGSNFWSYDFPMNQGTQSLVAAIRDDAGNTTYLTNTVVLSIVTNASYAYHDAGYLTNMTFTGAGYSKTVNLSWNSEYQLTAVSTNGVECERNGYGPLGRRTWTWDGSETNYLVYDGPHAVAEVDSTGGLKRAYVTAPGIDSWLAMTVYEGGTGATYFYITDHLGTVHAVADEDGEVVESYRYDAWGRVLGVYDGDGAPLVKSAIGNRILWQGREYSWNTGLYYFRARWYDPITGRWLSKDPIGIAGGLNQYVFCSDNPVNFRDPFGLCTEELPTSVWDLGWLDLYERLFMESTIPVWERSNPSGHGTIIYSSQLSYYVGGGAGFGTEVVQLDNGEIITYGYVQAGAGFGFGSRGAGASTQHGDVYNVYEAEDYMGPFINFSLGYGMGASGSVTPGGGAYSGSVGPATRGATANVQGYSIINRSGRKYGESCQ